MIFSSKMLQDGRYGIFIRNELAATVTCPVVCEKFVQALKERSYQEKQSENKIITTA